MSKSNSSSLPWLKAGQCVRSLNVPGIQIHMHIYPKNGYFVTINGKVDASGFFSIAAAIKHADPHGQVSWSKPFTQTK